jgi:hypothetical protein
MEELDRESIAQTPALADLLEVFRKEGITEVIGYGGIAPQVLQRKFLEQGACLTARSSHTFAIQAEAPPLELGT